MTANKSGLARKLAYLCLPCLFVVFLLLATHPIWSRAETFLALLGFAFSLPAIVLLLVAIHRYERFEAISRVEMQRLREAAHTDSLTGLGNHRDFQERLRFEVEKALKGPSGLSLAVIDLDDFKTINDRDGHARGDQVLIEFAELLRSSLRDGGTAYRIGGDEFALLVPGTPPDQVEALLETVREKTYESLERLTVSAGIASVDSQMNDVESLRDGADLALYEAKRRGRNMVTYFPGPGNQKTVVTTGKLDSLRHILEEGEVRVVFQPVWNVEWTSIFGYEALARFPGEELAGPREAFDLAERLGKAYELDRRCIQAVLSHVRRLPEDALLFLNISPRSLEHAGFSPQLLADQVTRAGIEPGRVCIEITERSTAPIEVIAQRCAELRRNGFCIALDNVGAGNSGLEILNRLPVEYVKIDSTVLKGAVSSSRSRAGMLAIVAFAVEAGAHVIAEGVETVEMLSLVRRTNGQGASLRIEGMQGRLLGRPGDIAAVTAAYEARRRPAS